MAVGEAVAHIMLMTRGSLARTYDGEHFRYQSLIVAANQTSASNHPAAGTAYC